ncbi:ABC transporter ATP-binding protein [Methylophaga sp.]|uniref:ABC transporter ATP-binding protein n=1 Tax=Methylophaga sp. TaxID=2024840 RepID=UPI0027174FBE|nr:ABC transporter ATP-binding protein [Methylophaga sp.]MDO8828289.1 ABC transporter ATP-binding protein [Methylophaga sp.]
MISAHDISVKIADKTLVEAISCDIAQGDYLCIVGPNGSGKSTFLKTLIAILPIHQGKLTIDSRPISQFSHKKLARLISYVPQNGGNHLSFTVDDYVRMARYSHHHVFSEWQSYDHDIVENALDITECQPFRHRKMSTLSGGECQRVMIAAALAQDTPVLILDEPTAFLDPHHQVAVHQLIRKLNQQHHKTIIEVTHDINHAAQHSKHVLALLDGKCLWHGPAEQFLNAERLQQLYQQAFVFIKHPRYDRLIALADES